MILLCNSIKQQPPLVGAGLIFLSLIPLYHTSYTYRLHHPWSTSPSPPQTSLPLTSSSDWIRDWLNTHLTSPFNAHPIASYCNQSQWHPNLVFKLDNANGGIGNVRGNFLDFLFQAIEAGASILLPGMASRSSSDLSNVWASRSDFDSFFDEEWFLKTMQETCPQMAIYKPQPGMELSPALRGNYLPRTRRMDAGFENNRNAYLAHLDQWLRANPDFDKDGLNLVSVERTLWDVDTRSLPQGLRRNFGTLLRVNPAIRRVAAVVARNMDLGFAMGMDPSQSITPGAFYGAHLRTEADAKDAGWLSGENANFSAQTDAYISEAIRHGFGVIYVASGNVSEVERFQDKVASKWPAGGLTVTSKFDLLPANDAAALKDLTFDQQALVDYEVLQRCSVFGGFVKSSFSYNIGITRNQWLEDHGRVTDPWRVQHSRVGVSFDDGISRMLGRDAFHEKRIPRGMWP